MKPRRSLILLFALLLVASGWVGAVAPLLAASGQHCGHADALAPSAPCCGDCHDASDCAQVCAPLFIASVSLSQPKQVPQPAPADAAVATRCWIALPQTRPPIA